MVSTEIISNGKEKKIEMCVREKQSAQTDDLKDRDRDRDGEGLVRARPVFTCALGWQRSRDDARAPLTSIRPCHFGTLIALGYDLIHPVSILFFLSPPPLFPTVQLGTGS